jgi:hypothetical protein
VHELLDSEPKILLMSPYRNLWQGELRALKVSVTILSEPMTALLFSHCFSQIALSEYFQVINSYHFIIYKEVILFNLTVQN